MAMQESTLATMLENRVQRHSAAKVYRWLADGERESAVLSYAELDYKARLIAGELRSRKVSLPVALLHRPGLEFIEALFGCLYAGLIAVPAYAPRSNRDRPRIAAILKDAGCGIALTTADSLDEISLLVAADAPEVLCVASDQLTHESNAEIGVCAAKSDAIAYLQYTSGSTSDPRGVMVTHANVLENLKYIASRGGFGQDSLSVNWLPHFHDMGLIYGVLQPLFSVFPAVSFSPAAFLHSPLRWLLAISRHRGTHCGGPNFAYDLCLERVSEEERTLLDLSSWQVAFNGAEPVRHETLDKFANHFAACGFQKKAFYPVYGLAEASLMVTRGDPGSGAQLCAVDADEIGRNKVLLVKPEAASARKIVGCGRAGGGHEIVVVNPSTAEPCGEDLVGEIWVAGPSVAAGYWKNVPATRKTFKAFLPTGQGPYLRTGDLGFLHHRELFITGRLKDCIIIRGRNHYPHDIEMAVEASHPAFRRNGCAAFALHQDGQERLVVVGELRRKHNGSPDEIIAAVRKAIAESQEIQVFAVVLIRAGGLPKTSSGKVQRQACKMKWLKDDLPVVAQNVLQARDPEREDLPAWKMLLEKGPDSRKALLDDYVRSLVARTLHHSMADLTGAHSLAGLGVDSLAGFELMRRIEKDLEVVIPIGGLLERNLGQVTSLILEKMESRMTEAVPGLQLEMKRLERPLQVPLSTSQAQVWLMQQLFPESCAYNEHIVVRLCGSLNMEALLRAIREMSTRHEILRTTFPTKQGHPCQSVQVTPDVDLQVVDISDTGANFGTDGHGTNAIEDRLRSIVTRETRRPFQLEKDLPVRFRLLRAGWREQFLLLVAHHIVCDGASLRVVVHELGTLYDAYARGEESPLPVLTIQYADYAVWQQEWIRSGGLEQQLGYWRRQLETMAPLELPTDRPRPAVMSDQGAAIPFALSDELTEKLKNLGQGAGVTLFMSLLAAFQVMLSKYAGQQDVTVGTAVANRNHAEVVDLIGFFVNTLVLRTDLSGDPSFLEVLDRVRHVALGAYQNQDLPFEKLVEDLQPERDMSRSPLFQVMLVFQPLPGQDLKFGDLKFSFPEVEAGVTKFDLTLRVVETNPCVRGYLEYSLSIFVLSTIQRMVRHLRQLLEQVVDDAAQPISRITMMSDAERQVLALGWSGRELPRPRQEHIGGIVAGHAKLHPRTIAAVMDGQQLTYGELDRRANQWAHYLMKQGVKTGTRVGVCLDQGMTMVVASLGVLKTGGVLVGLEPDEPLARITTILNNSHVSLVIAAQHLAGNFAQSEVQFISAEGLGDELTWESDKEPDVDIDADSPACVLYRSGGEGRPVGILIRQRTLCVPVFANDFAELATDEPDCVALSLSFSREMASLEMFRALARGARVVHLPSRASLPPRRLAVLLRDQKVAVLWASAAQLEEIGREFPWGLKSARRIVCNEPISVLDYLRDKLKPEVQELVQGVQGACEAGGWWMTHSLTGVCGQLKPEHMAAGTSLYLLDSQLEPVPEGVLGEIYFGGDLLALAYEHEPQQTATVFVPNPFTSTVGARMCGTGEWARRRVDGSLECCGRRDGRVIQSDIRIEVREIEAVLATHPGVVEAVVAMLEPSDKRSAGLAALVVGAAGQEVVEDDLKNFLRKRLPEAMIPKRFTQVDAIERSPRDGVDRRKLARRVNQDDSFLAAPGYVPPRNAIEEQVAGIWAQTFKLERVGIHDNFFELGGQSLLATQVVARISEVLHVELPLRPLFEAPTVAGLAEQVGRLIETGQVSAPPMRSVSREGDLPLSYAQQRMWFLHQLEPQSSAYNMPFGVRLFGDLNQQALELSLNEMVRRHESLRTSFVIRNGSPVQLIGDELHLTVEVANPSSPSRLEREAEAQRLAREEADKPFDLGVAPLVRMKLVQLEEHEYVLLVNMHHIVSDGWSSAIMIRELSRLYAAYVSGQKSPLQPLKIQYADYAVWQREWLQGRLLEQQLEYWGRQLAALEPLNLPTDHPRPAVMSQRGATVRFAITADLSGKIKNLAQREGVTLFMALLAGFELLLSKYAGQQDVVVGTPVANRNRVEVENLIGFFVNTLVLRTQLSGDPAFTEVLRRVRQVTLDAYQHQDVPFERLVEELQPGRDLGRSPLFQVMMVLQNTEQQELQMPGLRLSSFPIESTVAKFDLVLILTEGNEGLTGEINYARDLYEAETVERLARHFHLVLDWMVADPGRKVGELSLLGGAEWEQVLVEWNRTAASYPERCVQELFEEQAANTPAAIAVDYEGELLDYDDLNQRANQWGHYLRTLGVGPEVRVAICLERSAEMVVGLLGILKAGGVYVPLDANYPRERLAHMLKDSQAEVLISERQLCREVGEQLKYVDIHEDKKKIERMSRANPASGSTPESLAYVMYTSGSTGVPKGVAVEHRSIVRLVKNANFVDWKGQEVFLQLAPISFDASTFEVWGCLLNGGRLVVHPPHTPSMEELGEAIERCGVTVLWLTAGLFHQMVEGPVEKLKGVRQLLAGGDILNAAHVKRALAALPNTRIINGYGPTENTTFTCCHGMGPNAAGQIEDNVPIGRPISNTQVFVLAESAPEVWQPVPVGVAGELHIGGLGLARCYLNQPALTAEKFIPNPFSTTGTRLYRTGDRARWKSDGSLEFLGRLDDQVKLRGYRIELGEIEAALLKRGSVEQAVVVMRGSESDGKKLVAYVAGRDLDAGVKAGDLREYLRAKLPDYMVPSAIVVLDALPLTPNGKVDRKALPEPAAEREASEGYAAPRTPVEQIVAQIWSAVLKVGQVGRHDDFFELGGHSLLATRVAARLRSTLGIELQLRKLFEQSTVAELAAEIERLRGGNPEPMPGMQAVDRTGNLPLSYAQQRLWFLDQLEPGNAAYNISFGAHLSGELDRKAVEMSIKALVARHEGLRTTFPSREGMPVQSIADRVEFGWEEIDLRELEEAERALRAKRLAREDAATPFDLACGPLLRAKLLRLEEQEHVLLVNMHHIVSDGWSSGIMMREFSRLYAGYVNGEETNLPELKIQYADFAIWQREWLQGEVLEQQMGYWRQQLKELEPLDLPADHARPAVMSRRGAVSRFLIAAELNGKLKELAQREGVTLFMGLLAAFQVMLSKYAGRDDIAVGTAVANRNRTEIENVVGFFVNTLVLRTALSGNPSFTEVLTRVRQVALDAYQHQDVPFEKLVEELDPGRDLSRSPLFQVMMVLQNNEQQELRMPGLRLSAFPIDTELAKFDLLLTLSESAEGLAGEISYACDLYEAETVARATAHLRMVLELMVARPETRISEISLLTEAERQQVLAEWTRTERLLPRQCIHELFESRALRAPGAVAVTCAGDHLIYSELNRRANCLASYLRKLGVGLETRVAICMDRSLEMVIGLLGILKAGGAYVPLDPNSPPERLSYILEDSQAALLLTHRSAQEWRTQCAPRLLEMESAWEQIEQESGCDLQIRMHPENAAYVIYTSGSTGLPKGVVITHSNVMRLMERTEKWFQFNPQDVVTMFHSYAFDFSVWELWGALHYGGRLVLVPYWISRSPEKFLELVIQEGVTVLNQTPSAFQQFIMAEESRANWEHDDLPLRVVIFAGEALEYRALRGWFRRHRERPKLVNMYGITETTVHVTYHQVQPDEVEEKEARSRIGVGIPDLSLYVLDESMQPLPVGVKGELYVGGDGLARGYWHRVDLTAQRFVPNPFAEREGERVYRSGDQVTWRRDGGLDYHGRLDHQVKVRGYRIELGEIEAALLDHPGVEQAVATVLGEGEDKRIVVYIVEPDGSAGADSQALREFLRDRLPDYMVPSAFVLLEALPLTSNGKIDRKALPKPERPAGRESESVGPRNEEEEILCRIFGEVLNLERVGVELSFFDAGGHSLLATQVISRIRSAFKIELPVRALFETPTVVGLAERVSRMRGMHPALAPGLARVSRERELPLSYAQQRLWFLDQLEPESAAYNVPIAIRLRGDLDRTGVEKSLREIVKRHEVLRTTFTVHEGTPVQQIAAVPLLGWDEADLRDIPSAAREEEAARLVLEETVKPFDLRRGPLLRARLLCLEQREHVLVVNMHHIVSDGWSMGILIREFAQLYGAHLHGESASLPELPVQYADFSAWQKTWLQDQVLEKQLAYWKKQLADVAVLEMPTDRPRPPVESHRGGSARFDLHKDLTDRLNDFCRREGATLFMNLLTALTVALGRYTGQKDIAVGTDVANRNRVEIEGLIGFFVNQLVLRTDLSDFPGYRELLTRIRRTTLEAYEHQDVPFERLVEEVQIGRDLGRAPLFQIKLVVQNTPGGFLRIPGIEAQPFDTGAPQAKLDLELIITEQSEGSLSATAIYATDLFDQGTMERFLGHVMRVVEMGMANPDQDINELDLLGDAERAEVLEAHNQTALELPDQSAHELFELQAEHTPEAVAVAQGGEEWSYRKLNRRANQLARYLRGLGVGPEVRVGVYMERTPEMVMTLLGILKAGGVYVPLDPSYPTERLAFMVKDSSLPVVLTSKTSFPAELSADRSRVLNLGKDWSLIALESEDNLTSIVHPESLAYVMYTSGSTGLPKGVMITQRGMLNHLRAKIVGLGLGAWDVVAQNAPSSFDISIWQLLAALLAGGSICIMSDDTARDARQMLRETEEHGVTVLETVPTMLAVMMTEQQQAVSGPLPLRGLRWLVSNAEALPSPMCSQWRTMHPHVALMNTYGPTECSDDVCDCQIGEPLPEGLPYAPLGLPVMNAMIYVLDPGWRPVPLGVAGELYIGGLCLARGYLNRPDLTAEKFVPNPYSRHGEDRMYRTGDVGRWRADGHLEFLGRADQQVKIRGQRIELGEIEAALGAHPSLEQAVVVVQNDKQGEKRLVAYAVGKNSDERINHGEIREYLLSRLPRYMLPGAFVQLNALPLTPSGKLDRKALPAPELGNEDSGSVYSGPRTPEEEILCDIVSAVLNRQRVAVEDNFFEIGGHSLLATQVIARARGAFNVDLPLRALFEAPTVKGLAESVRAARGVGAAVMPPLVRADRSEDLPLSFAQQRLWFLDQLEPGSAAYNIPFGVRFRGELNREVWRRSLKEIVRRHEVLRTSFPVGKSGPVQAISEEAQVVIEEIDLSGLEAERGELEAAREARAEASKPFALERGPLLRVKLLRLGDQDHVMLVTIHHIVSDGWSTGIMVREFMRLYQAYWKAEESPLPELAIQYADYSLWQREWLQGEVLEKQLQYWKRQLLEVSFLELPADRPRPAVPSRRAARLPYDLGPELKTKLEVLSRSAGSTLYMTLLAAFQVLLSRYSGQADVVVGAPIAGRRHPETEPLIGMFFNMLALRSDINGGRGFLDLLGEVREMTLAAYAHQDLPFERLVAELDLERNLSYHPLFQVIFELDNTPQEQIALLPGLEIESFGIDYEVAKVDLTLSLFQNGGELSGSLQYSTDLFDETTLQRLMGQYRRLLEGIVDKPEKPISELPLLSQAEWNQVVVEWNQTAVEFSNDRCMHELFEHQVEKTPENVALEYQGRRLTYRELDVRANQLGHYLRKVGVGPEVRVGICVGRSLEMVIGLLGILKAGGAYIPLDPTYPVERAAYMIADSGASVVLTQASLFGRLAQTEGKVGPALVCLDTQWQEIAGHPEGRPPSHVSPHNLAYIYYTSGSTGRPKGVAIAHCGIANYIRWGIEAYQAAAGHGAPVHSSIAVDLTLTNFLPLFAGQMVVLAPETPGVDGLLGLLRDAPEFSLLKLTPTHLTLLNPQLTEREMAGSARVLVIGADNLVAEPTLSWRERAPNVVLLNEYGPTETVVGCSIYRIEASSPRSGGMPIGRPIANLTMYVLDRHGFPLPQGVPGELYIGGIGVARGYWQRPDLTAEKFLPDPYADEPGARFYRTGDRARFLPDGNLEFLGRLDHQVKIRGFRIETGEVEAVLSGCPGVHKAMVVVREDAPGEKRLVAYVAAPVDSVDVSGLRSYLRERLPDYMVPAAFVVMEALPVRASGKIDPKDLPRPEIGADREKYVAPRTETEKTLSQVWEAVLGVAHIGVHDNFFEMGGDSILSIQVITRAQQAGVRLTAQQVFERQTIAELAEVVGSGSEVVQAEQGIISGAVRLTPMQLALLGWNLTRLDHFNQSVLLELPSDVNTTWLEQAVTALLEHHDMLRMRFEKAAQGWEQWCEERVPGAVYERRGLVWFDDEEQNAELERDAAQAQSSLDLEIGRVIKAVEYDLGPRRGLRLLLVIHHLVMDGVSWRVLLEDLENGYQQLNQGLEISLPPKTTSFKQWAERLWGYAQEEQVKQEMKHWSAELNKRARPLPRDFEDGDAENLYKTLKTVTVSLEQEETRALLQDIPGVYRTQINDVLLAALARALMEWSASPVLVDIEGHGREEIFAELNLARTVGWFTSVYPVLLAAETKTQWRPDMALGGIKEQLRNIPKHGVGYQALRYLTDDEQIRGRLAAMPQAEISFNYLGQVDQLFRQSKLLKPAVESTGQMIAGENRRPYVVDVVGMVAGGRLQLNWLYSEQLHRRETIERIADCYAACLRELIVHCRAEHTGGHTPSDFPVAGMSQQDLMQIASVLDE